MKKISKKEKIKLLLQLNRTVSGTTDNIAEILNNMDKTMLGDDAEEFDNFKNYLTSQLGAFKENQLTEQINIYDKYLSEECIDGAIAYYMSASGREISENINKIQHELVTLGMNMINDIMEKYETDKGGTQASYLGMNSTPVDNKQAEFDDFKKRYNLE